MKTKNNVSLHYFLFLIILILLSSQYANISLNINILPLKRHIKRPIQLKKNEETGDQSSLNRTTIYYDLKHISSFMVDLNQYRNQHTNEQSKKSKHCFAWTTFGNRRYNKTMNRIIKQAKNFPLLDYIIPYDDNILKTIGFIDRYELFIKSNERGYGYWIWKPFIINYTLHNVLPDNCFLLYTDSGSSFNMHGMTRAIEYMEMMKAHKKHILAYQMNYIESSWTKGDIFDFFDARNIPDTGQFAATLMLLYNSETSRRFANRWMSIIRDNIHLVTDQQSNSMNFPNFYENRHDQSIYSMLLKTEFRDHVIVMKYEEETWSPAWDSMDWSSSWESVFSSSQNMHKYPFWATRFRFME